MQSFDHFLSFLWHLTCLDMKRFSRLHERGKKLYTLDISSIVGPLADIQRCELRTSHKRSRRTNKHLNSTAAYVIRSAFRRITEVCFQDTQNFRMTVTTIRQLTL
jgi:hypothetical protein